MTGPLSGTRVIELAAQGPAPFACMLLADLGAEVITIERPGGGRRSPDAHWRGRRSVCLNLKSSEALRILLDLVEGAQVLIEGFRPGVAERLGVGPQECLTRNPELIYGRMTGWGQQGPLAFEPGHDINYLALSGALHSIGEVGRGPVPPLNLVADYGGGGMLLALGVVAGLAAAQRTGVGQIVDAAMIDGVAAMLAPFHTMSALGVWKEERGGNLLDGGAPFYGLYETSDGNWVSVGAIEPQFYADLIDRLGLNDTDLTPQMDRSGWQSVRETFAGVFRTRTRDEWVEHFHGSQACMQPVLTMKEAVRHPHAKARNMFEYVGNLPHPAPAPRFSATPLDLPPAPEGVGASTARILSELGYSASEIDRLTGVGAVE